jgi:hypothetical protein
LQLDAFATLLEHQSGKHQGAGLPIANLCVDLHEQKKVQEQQK